MSNCTTSPHRKILALKFQLEANNGKIVELIACAVYISDLLLTLIEEAADGHNQERHVRRRKFGQCPMPGDEIKRLRCEILENHKSRVSRCFEFGVVSGPCGIAGAGAGVRWQIALPGSGPEVTTLEVVAQELVPVLLKRRGIRTLGRLHTCLTACLFDVQDLD